MARAPVHWWWWQHHCNKGTMPAWGGQWHHHGEGNNAVADQGRQHHCYEGDDAIYRMARMPAHQQRQWHHYHEGNNCHHNNGKNPVHWWQQYHCDEGNDASLMTSNKGNNASSTMAETCLCINNGNIAIMTRATIAIRTMAKTPLHWRQWRQLDNEQQGQQHEWWQGRHCNKGNDTSLRTAMTPSRQGQQCYCGSKATTPLLWEPQQQLDDGKDACALTTATMPLSWGWKLQWQQLQGCLSIDSNDAIMTRATMPAQWRVTRAKMLVQQQQRWLRINDGNNTIMTRSTFAIATTAKIQVHQWQQCHHDKGDDASLTTSNKGDDACMRTHSHEHIICSCSHAPSWT